MEQWTNKIKDSHMKELFIRSRKNISYSKIMKILTKSISQRKKYSFSCIHQESLSPNKDQIVLYSLFERLYPRKFLNETRKVFIVLKNKI